MACLLAVLLYVAMYLRTPFVWRSVEGMPVMPLSVPWLASYSEGSACGQIWCTRVTGFWTSAPPEAVQAFYRERLALRGWHYRCTVDAGLPWCFSPPERGQIGLGDLFDKPGVGSMGWDPLVIEIGEAGQSGWRSVRIVEPAPLLWQSDTLPIEDFSPVKGSWRGTDSEGRPFLLRLLRYNVLWIERDAGVRVEVADNRAFMWFLKEDGQLELWSASVRYGSSGQPCPELPAFLHRSCAPSGNGLAELSVMLTMRLHDGTMTLTTPDGQTQTLRQDNDQGVWDE